MDIVELLSDEADLCRNDGADDIANLIDTAKAEIETLRSKVVELWHDSNARHGALHECLGMTLEQYATWVSPAAIRNLQESTQ